MSPYVCYLCLIKKFLVFVHEFIIHFCLQKVSNQNYGEILSALIIYTLVNVYLYIVFIFNWLRDTFNKNLMRNNI